MNPGVLVLDYANARTKRIMAALHVAGIEARLTHTPLEAKNAAALVVPDGDDSDAALDEGVSAGVFEGLAEFAATGRPLLAVGLGVCFLLSGRSHPSMPAGLDIFRVPVQRFDPRLTDETERPLLSPHLGPSLVVGLDRHPYLGALVPKGDAGVWLSFRHRLCAPSRVAQADVAVCHHGVPFAGALWRDNILAVQFLPEQSGTLGIDVLRAWGKHAVEQV